MGEQPRTTTQLIAAVLVTGKSVWVDLVWFEPDPDTGQQTVQVILPMTDEGLREHWRRGGLESRTYERTLTVDADGGPEVDWAADLLVTDVVADMRRDHRWAELAMERQREKLPGGQDTAEFFREEGFGHLLDE